MTTSFNPRARKGRDGVAAETVIQSILFQSTRPQGARHNMPFRIRFRMGFNPRARKGRDMVVDELKAILFGFNPRARKGRDSSRKIPSLSCALGSVSANAR